MGGAGMSVDYTTDIKRLINLSQTLEGSLRVARERRRSQSRSGAPNGK